MEETLPVKQAGHYQITANDVGVYLSVWAPGKGGWPVAKAVIIQELTERNFTNFDSEFISQIIREATGTPVLIVNTQPRVAGRYEISANDTGVYLTVWAPGNGGWPVAKTTIIKDLTDRNVTDFDSNFISKVIREATGTPVLIVNAQPRIAGRYEISANDTGVYLSVWAPGIGGWPVLKATIIKDLMNRNCTNFESDFISQVIREAIGSPVLIINNSQAAALPPKNKYIKVKVGFERLEARVSITIPADRPTATRSDILEELNAAGVVHGIDEQAIAMLTKTNSIANVVCARGIPPCRGEDAYLKYAIDPDSQGRPVELADGRVDFKETNHFLCVEEGQLLVEKVPATPGIPGTDVYGLPLPPKPGKDIRMPTGKNVINVEDWRLYAAIPGHLSVFLDKRINVIPIIVIDGDIDYSTGNIDFKGSVIVRGSVQQDFSIKAGGNVEVAGTISGGMVEANNIIVHKGIQGMRRSIIKARERLVANFVENATVYADTDIIVNDFILNSAVYAGSRVIVEGGRGLIRGGCVSAGELVTARIIGNQSGVITEIDVAANTLLKDELLKFRQEIKKAEATYSELEQALAYFHAQGIEQLSSEKRERYEKYKAECEALPDQMEELRQHVENMESILKIAKPGRVRVCGCMYPGTKVAIGSLTKVVNDPVQFVALYVLDGEIKCSSLR
ncbi:FapA family protein [Sporomusa acidovorans]|nr:FapA family protein [Sporomusa acidovorans]